MHWIALLHGRVDLSLAATGGVHSAEEVIKLLLAGADVTQMAATLLTHGEYQLLSVFLRNSGHTLSRDQLMDQIRNREWVPSDRSIDVLVGRLRRKLHDDPAEPGQLYYYLVRARSDCGTSTLGSNPDGTARHGTACD